MTKRITLIVLVFATCCFAPAQDASPRYFGVKWGALAEVKARLTAGDKALPPALKHLEKEAADALQIAPPSVMQKSKATPSGDPHDYMSTAPYYWPDSRKSNGLPYIRHDGKVNPESRENASDHGRVQLLANTVETLALAYWFTGKETYAAHAARCLQVWFLDPATRMNPNLDYAQAVPGVNTGRGTGIIEGRNIAVAADAAGLLAGSSAWTQPDNEALKAWLKTYLDWLMTSKNGRDEAGARNNHGTLYDVQAMRLALILGRTDLARSIAEAAGQKRIVVQIQADGRQPLELERTASFSYSKFNLEALFALATLADQVGVDLWHYRLPGGLCALPRAVDFLLPYVADPTKPWPYEQIKHVSRTDFGPVLRQAAVVYHEPKYEKVLAAFPEVSRERLQLLYPSSKLPSGKAAAMK